VVAFTQLFLVVQHRQVEIDQLKIAGRRRVVTPFQFAVESFRHVADTRVDLHTHLGYLHLQTSATRLAAWLSG